MFGFGPCKTTLRRFAISSDDDSRTGSYFIERSRDGRRLADGKAFPSIMAAFMLLGTLLCSQGEPLRIVDAEGKPVYASKPGDTVEAGARATAA